MKIKLVLPAAVALGALAALPATGQCNATDFQGFASRGIAMYDNSNYIGCIDQLRHALTLAPVLDNALVEDVDYYLAMAMLRSGDRGAKEALTTFLEKYPASLRRQDVRFSLANIVFAGHDYVTALQMYADIDRDALSLARAQEYDYNVGICKLKLGAYDDAARCFNALLGTDEYGNAANFYLAYIDYATGHLDEAVQGFAKVNTALAPGNMADYYLCQIYYTRGDYDSALTKARAVLRENLAPDGDTTFEAEADRIAGESLYRLGSQTEAIPYLKKYMALTPDPRPSALYVLGLSEYSAGNYDEAIDLLQRVAQGEPDVMVQSAYLYIGQARLHRGENDLAIIAFDKALTLGFDRNVKEAAYYNYAVTRFKGGTLPFGKLAATFEDFLRQFPGSHYAGEVRRYLVNGYIAEHDYESALKALDNVADPNAQTLEARQYVLYCLGARALNAGTPQDAVDWLKRAVDADTAPSDTRAEARLLLGEAYYALGQYVDAASQLKTYLTEAPRNAANRQLALYDLGYALFQAKDYAGAADAFTKLTDAPGSMSKTLLADAFNRLGDCRFYASEFVKADKAYDKALSLNSETGDYALFQKGLISGYRRDYKDKITRLDALITSYPTSALVPDALLEMTESYLRLGDTTDALATYRNLIAAYPSTRQGRQAYLQMAMTLANTGDNAASKKTYMELIERYPTSDEAAQAVDMLKSVCADDGTLAELNSFLLGIKGAPRLDPSQTDMLTFDAAEKEYLENGSTARLEAYIAEWPAGKHVHQVLDYLAADAYESGDLDKAYAYALRIVGEFPDSSAARTGLIVKARIDGERGNAADALDAWKKLEQSSSSAALTNEARQGIMRAARDMGKYDDVIAAADALLSSSAVGAEDKNEAIFSRGIAYYNLGQNDKAEADWETIADRTDDINGAKAAYYLGQSRFDRNDLKGARKAAEALNASGTPHTYWLGRGFILLSDVYAAEGRDFEAKEYLKALRENYPGNESDIFLMIDSRLAQE